MSPRLRRLYGRETIAVMQAFGFEPVSQKGSHIKLRRVAATGEKQRLAVPEHRDIDTGTLLAIYRQALRYVPEQELRPQFYTD